MTLPKKTNKQYRQVFAGVWTLVRFILRSDRNFIFYWVLGVGLYVLYTIIALPSAFPTQEDLIAGMAIYADPLGRLMTGPAYGFDNPSLPQVIVSGYGLYFLILIALMSIFLVIRHTRVEEQTGRAELVYANVVGHGAPLAAALIAAVIVNLLAAVLALMLMVFVGEFEFAGSLLFAVGGFWVGMAFAGIASIATQLSEHSKTATGIAGAILGATFVARAGGDMAAIGGSALSWTSPLAWAQQTAPFVLDRWWPLWLLIGLSFVSILIGYRLSTKRDVGAGIMATRGGSAYASPSLGTPFGLAFRLQKTSILAWTISLGLSGIIFGAYVDTLLDSIESWPEALLEVFGGSETVVAGYISFLSLKMAYFAATYAILAIQGLKGEEDSGRAEHILSTPTSRRAWLGSNIDVALLGVIIIMAITGALTGLGVALVSGDNSFIASSFWTHINQIPAILVMLGVAALLFGFFPRFLSVIWLSLGAAAFVGLFGSLVSTPQFLIDISPFEYAAKMPIEDFNLRPVIGLLILAIVTALGGLVGIGRRSINVK